MTFTRFKIASILCFCCFSFIKGEFIDSTLFTLTNISTFSNGNVAPFWLQTNKAGQIAAQPNSNSLSFALRKDFNQFKNYGVSYGIEALYQAAPQNSKLYFHEAYIEGKLYFLSLTLGMRNQYYGNQYVPLSSGGMLFSGNCRPLPMIRVYTPEYIAVPLTHGLIEIRGVFENAWAGDNSLVKNTLIHYKNAFIRIGGTLPVRINCGLHHVVQWGGDNPTFGHLGSSFKDFIDVVGAKSGESGDPIYDQINRKGNHIMSQNLGIEISIFKFEMSAYWQQLSEDPPINLIINTPNRPDKLLGFSISNNYIPYIQKFLIEYFNTTDESGPYHDKDGVIFGGSDSYFENYLYPQGYSYYGRIIGTPLITSPVMNIDGNTGVANNSIEAWHFGMLGSISDINYRLLVTHSQNYGVSFYDNYNNAKENYSILTEFSAKVKKLHDVELIFAMGCDRGKLFGNSLGVQFGFRSNLLLKKQNRKDKRTNN